jgi:hypothetical protein
MNILKPSGQVIKACIMPISQIQTQIDLDLLKEKIDYYFGKHQSLKQKEERYVFGKECKYSLKTLCDNKY